MAEIKVAQQAIVAKGLTKRFGDFTAVDGVDFQVARGEIFGFLGPNGSGKTTTIRMLLGLLQPTAGEAHVLGVDVRQHPERIRSNVGYMSQRFSLYNDLTVMQNLRFYGTAYDLENKALRERIEFALDFSGLRGHERTRTRDLSGGWRQRLALGASILHQPQVLFLDEPTAGVDPISRRAFWELLYRIAGQGVTVFVTTHYMDEAEHCHRLAFLQRGRIIALGGPEEIKREEMRGRVYELEVAQPTHAVQALREAMRSGGLPIEDVQLFGSLVHVVTRDPHVDESALKQELERAGLGAGAIALTEPSLEDVFIACVNRG